MFFAKNFRTILLLFILFIIGFFYRYLFITLVPQPILYDQREYMFYAGEILKAPDHIAAFSYRTYPYSLLIAIFIAIFSWTFDPIYFFQIFLDTTIGILIFILLRSMTKSKITPWVGCLLYMLNPFTSGYVGTLLTEILTAFTMTITIFFGSKFMKNPHPLIGLLIGLFAGIAAMARTASFFWVLVPVGLLLLFQNIRKNIVPYACIILGLSLTVLYQGIANYKEYKEFTISTVDDFFAREFWNGVTLKKVIPHEFIFPLINQQMWYEYYSEHHPGRSTEERKAMAQKYWQDAVKRIKADPIDYIQWRFIKMVDMWQKEFIFFYKDPFFPKYRYIIWLGNFILFLLAIIGMFTSARRIPSKIGLYNYLSLLFSILYATVTFSFSHAEYRITIPFYPMLLSFTAMGMHDVIAKCKTNMAKKTYEKHATHTK